MGQIYLVRHAQASLGAANYDQLSPLGLLQSERLGSYFAQNGVTFEAAYTGTLDRQRHTLTHLFQGLSGLSEQNLRPTPIPTSVSAALNEYNSLEVIRSVHAGEIPNPGSRLGYKAYFKLLRQGLLSWMTAQSTPAGMPSFMSFSQNVIQLLLQIKEQHTGTVLIVSSGGPIACILAHLLQASDNARIELNLGLRNTAVSELRFNAHKLSVVSFNTTGHLSGPEFKDWITYA